jgi:hypothetical protein
MAKMPTKLRIFAMNRFNKGMNEFVPFILFEPVGTKASGFLKIKSACFQASPPVKQQLSVKEFPF